MFIELSEDVSVKNIKALYNELKDNLDDGKGITLDFSRVARIDLSLAQVILLLGKELKKNGKKLKLKSVSDDVRRLLLLSGMKGNDRGGK